MPINRMMITSLVHRSCRHHLVLQQPNVSSYMQVLPVMNSASKSSATLKKTTWTVGMMLLCLTSSSMPNRT